MSSEETAIRVEGLGKCFQIYDRPENRLKQSILPRIQRALGRPARHYFREFWALRNVSFEVQRGETVGIIGRNGSGKSTLLQMICGTLAPTTGRVETQGRVAALLELGAGFNPEFTGRENVYLNGSLLGFSRSEMDARFDAIAAFADIGEFIEQPVKHYSSGMYARLAFSVAISVDPDILVVDEALAVGDEPFQRKCFARIENIRSEGGTILFVSHSGGTIISLCDRAILLNRGERLFTGESKRAVFYSQKLGNTHAEDSAALIEEILRADSSGAVDAASTERDGDKGIAVPAGSSSTIEPFMDRSFESKTLSSYEENGARIEEPALLTMSDNQVNHILPGGRYKLRSQIVFTRDCPGVRFFALIRTTAGIDLAGCAHPAIEKTGLDFSAGTRIELEMEFTCSLNPATYFCSFAVQSIDGSLHHRIVDALVFRVMSDAPRPATGLVDIGFQPTIRERSDTTSAS